VFPKGFRLPLVTIAVWVACFPHLARAQEAANLTPNPAFAGSQDPTGLPDGWHRDARKIPGVEPSRVYLCRVTGYPGKLLAMEGTPDRNGQVCCQLPNIRPRTDYLLKFTAYRPKFTNSAYLEVEIFGRRHSINQHFSYGRVQPIFLRINSGNTQGATRFVVANPQREVIAFGSPSLTAAPRPQNLSRGQPSSVRLPSFFPVGIFAAKPEDSPDIRAAGFNAVQSYDVRPDIIRSMAAISARLGLKFLPSFLS
jgi:hypothetical protein